MPHRRFRAGMVAALTGLLAMAPLAGCGPQETTTTGTNTTEQKKTELSPTGTTSEGTTFLIGMSQPNKGEPWRQAMYSQVEAAAAKHKNLKVVFADAAQNNTKQVSDVENFLQQKIDLLIISPNEAAPLTDVVAKVYDAGIPVIVLDRKVNGDKYTTWIGGDNKEIGKQAGTYVADWCKAQNKNPCNIIELRGLEGSTPTKERGDGFRAGLARNPNAKIIASQSGNWLREKAVTVSQSMFAANANVDVVYGHNDPMAEAAIISAEASKKDLSKILFVGIDGLPTPDGGIKSVKEGRLGATYIYPTGGEQAIELALAILEKKEKPPKSMVLPTEQVTKENADAILAKYGGT